MRFAIRQHAADGGREKTEGKKGVSCSILPRPGRTPAVDTPRIDAVYEPVSGKPRSAWPCYQEGNSSFLLTVTTDVGLIKHASWLYARTPSGRRAGGNIGDFGTDSSKSRVRDDLRS